MDVRHLLTALALGISASLAANATDKTGGFESAAASSDYVTAEVRKVDAEQGKVTLKHGPIENLGMPPMTMVFRVADPAMLQQVKTGDKVKFKADRADGAFRVVEMVGQEPTPAAR